MPVGERKAATSVVISPRYIKPRRLLHPKCEGGIIQIVKVLIDQHPEHCRSGSANGGNFAISKPWPVAAMVLLIIQPRSIYWQRWSPGVLPLYLVKCRTNCADCLAHRERPGCGHGLA